MTVLCPHCQTSIEKTEPASEDFVCASCGASVRIEADATAAWIPTPQQRTLGKFELLELVGAGAFGSVYKAKDNELGRIVAVKIPRSGNIGSSGDSDRFLREARSVAQLRHPSIVSVFEIGSESGMPYLVSEFVNGITLADLLTSERPPPRIAALLVADVAEALHYAHQEGVVHRDVKPSNIMLESCSKDDGPNSSTSRRYVPRIMDFGLAKRDAGEITMTTEGEVLGTPAYMSPEQARGDSHSVDKRGDVYSLGVILYQLLTGELPFKGNTRMLLHQVLNDEPKPPRQRDPKLPKDLETICLKAMAKEPSRRYAAANEMAADLRRFLSGEPINARPVGSFERAWRWSKRNPAVAALSTAVVLLIAGLGGLAVSRSRPGPVGKSTTFSLAKSNEKQEPPTDDLLKVVSELDRTDPGWRLERFEAKRKHIPDEQNSAILVRNIHRLLFAQFVHGPNQERDRDLIIRRGLDGSMEELYPELTQAEVKELIYGESRTQLYRTTNVINEGVKDLTPTTSLSPERAGSLRSALQSVEPALIDARKLAQLPNGRYPIVYSHDAFNTLLPHGSEISMARSLLEADCVLRVLDGRMDDSLASCCAIMSAGRSVGDEPFGSSQMMRITSFFKGIAKLEWLLAHGEASELGLAMIQDLLHQEVAHPKLLICVRGERAGVHWNLSAIEAGDFKPDALSKEFKQMQSGLSIRPAHAWVLRRFTSLVEIAQQPLEKQLTLAHQWQDSVPHVPEALEKWYEAMAIGTLYPQFIRTCLIDQARLRACALALAVERYRVVKKAWPEDLSSLVPQYVAEVPTDPFTAQPLNYRRTPDGTVVYSVGPDGVDNKGSLDRSVKPPDGSDIGFQLWDVAKRRLWSK